MKKTILTLMVVILGIFFIGFQQAVACEFPSCETCPGTGTPGYWMNHPDAWPVDSITIGGVNYTIDEAIALMKAPVKGDKSLTMFPAAVAANLNVLNGCIGPDFCLDEADWWLGEFPPGSNVRGNSEAWQHSHGEWIYFCLDSYNNGEGCVPSRDSLE